MVLNKKKNIPVQLFYTSEETTFQQSVSLEGNLHSTSLFVSFINIRFILKNKALVYLLYFYFSLPYLVFYYFNCNLQTFFLILKIILLP